MLTICVFLIALTVDGLTHANRVVRSSFSDIMRIMIHIEGTLNIVWIADVRNDEGCTPHLVSNEVNRKQHAVIAGHRILRFLTKMNPSS